MKKVLAAGLALFSMFFGAGDLIWPLILGGETGDKTFFSMLGLLVTGVSLPLLGLISMMLFLGDYNQFFGRLGRPASFIVILVVQLILGPLGSIPRLITLSYATLGPYLPSGISLASFSVLAGLVVLLFTIKRHRVVDILGLFLTPILLLSLGAILVLGLTNHPDPIAVATSQSDAFKRGLSVGYNTLDLIASFIFAPLVLGHFLQDKELDEQIDCKKRNRQLFKKMLQASCVAAGLLALMYIGLTHVASYYTPLLDVSTPAEGRLAAISMHLLGPHGALVASIAVAMACLTTAIPLVCIFADYLQDGLKFRKEGGKLIPLLITLAVSAAIANIGFMGIAGMLSPMLEILCPGLIVLSVLNIGNKLFETRLAKAPVFATFALSTAAHFTRFL